jgi:predicted acylesterase/phospholipase RssA
LYDWLATFVGAGRRQRTRSLDVVSGLLWPILIPLVVLNGGCATDLGPRVAVPVGLVESAAVSDLENIRFWGDSKQKDYAVLTERRIAAIRELYGDKAANVSRDSHFLTLSGGGSDGAFGAGLLVGWTERGDRPRFDFVTGVSTGAMMAPLAFLGPKYDAKLREAYTTLTDGDVATPQILSALVGASAGLADTTPLKGLVAKYMTAEMLAEIAAEHRNGRALMIGTTNLDAQRAVIWDIGAIAASGSPSSLNLIRQIILASAAIPGAFPPVEIDVTAGGRRYQELHVDGGVTRQVFLYPPGFSPKVIDGAIGWKIRRRLFIIRNTKVDPEFSETQDQIIPIATRSISTLIKTQGVGDLYQIYVTAKRDGVDYNLAYIPPDFAVPAKSAFDKTYMNALFQRGYELGRAGYPWHKQPPGLDVNPHSTHD